MALDRLEDIWGIYERHRLKEKGFLLFKCITFSLVLRTDPLCLKSKFQHIQDLINYQSSMSLSNILNS